MYNEKFDANIEIDGITFYAEDISPTESFSRRDIVRTPIMYGTQSVTQGDYIPKQWSFKTHLDIEPNKRDMYDNDLKELMYKPCRILCPDMGEMFYAQVIVQKTPVSPRTLELSFTLTELPNIDDYYIDNVIITTNRQEINNSEL